MSNKKQNQYFWFSPNTDQCVQLDTKKPNETIELVWIGSDFRFFDFLIFYCRPKVP